ncbi:unnamed protein product, partial [Meganyctiphanes norvegica]
MAWTNVSKLCLGLSSVMLKLKRPPKTCMPRRAKIIIKRNKSNKRDAMDWMELSNDATRFDNDRHYFVTLKILSNLTQRSTDTPRGGIISVLVSATSVMELMTIMQSNRLNNETA